MRESERERKTERELLIEHTFADYTFCYQSQYPFMIIFGYEFFIYLSSLGEFVENDILYQECEVHILK